MDTTDKNRPHQRLRHRDTAHLDADGDNALVHWLALRLVEHLRMLTAEIDELATEITERVTLIAASLLAIVGWGPLTAAKIIGETQLTGDGGMEALRVLNRRLPDVVYRAMLTDQRQSWPLDRGLRPDA
jgi:transposase